MGLQSQLDDFSSDSIPLYLVAILANFVKHLRSFLVGVLHSAGFSRFSHGLRLRLRADDGLFTAVGSGLANLIVLAEQLNLNRVFSYRYGDGVDDAVGGGSDCVVCLCSLSDGDQVRRLACRHVFHKDCFDGWLDHLNFNCPLCRSPLVPDERVPITRRRVGEDLIAWFSIR